MKVLYINPFRVESRTVSGGIFADRQIESLRRTGVHADEFGFGQRLNPLGVLAAVRELRRRLQVGGYDLVHAQYGSVTALVAVLAAGRVPVVVSFCGSDLNGSPDVPAWRSHMGVLASRLAALGAAGVICKSGRLRDRLWWGRRKAEVIPNGVDTAAFGPLPREECRQKLGLDPDRIYLVFNDGNRDPVKRLDLAQEVASRIDGEWTDGQAELHLLRDVEPDAVVYHLNAADALIVTSDAEGSPNIVKEAMACGLPIVSFDVGDVAERLATYPAGRIVARDIGAMASAVTGLLAERPMVPDGYLDEIGLGEDAIARRVRDHYRRVLGA